MSDLGEKMRRLTDYWALGCRVLLMAGVAAVVGAIVAGLVALLLQAVFGWEDATWTVAASILGAVTVPIWIGHVANSSFRTLPRLPLNKRASSDLAR